MYVLFVHCWLWGNFSQFRLDNPYTDCICHCVIFQKTQWHIIYSPASAVVSVTRDWPKLWLVLVSGAFPALRLVVETRAELEATSAFWCAENRNFILFFTMCYWLLGLTRKNILLPERMYIPEVQIINTLLLHMHEHTHLFTVPIGNRFLRDTEICNNQSSNILISLIQPWV